jgi:hypothetical protein
VQVQRQQNDFVCLDSYIAETKGIIVKESEELKSQSKENNNLQLQVMDRDSDFILFLTRDSDVKIPEKGKLETASEFIFHNGWHCLEVETMLGSQGGN